MELREPETAMNEQEQHQPDPQSDELGFQSDEPSITDQLQALSLQPQEEKGGCSGSKEGESSSSSSEELEVEEMTYDDDAQQNDGKLQSGSEIGTEEKEDASGNGDENGERRGVEVRAGKKKAAKKEKSSRPFPFPVRPEAEKCAFYLRTGTCKYGMNCKFNHPPKRQPSSGKTRQKAKVESSEKAAKINCKNHDQHEGCKSGKVCNDKQISLNFLGLPIRPGEIECAYYMQNGSCKYGSSCRFNHPDPAALETSDTDTPPEYSNGGPVASQGGLESPLEPWYPPPAMNDTHSYMPLMFPPAQGIPSSTEWNNYQAPFYTYESTSSMPMSAAYTANSPVLETSISGQQKQMPVDEFPKRPGQPHCQYYLRTGDCKYKSACKFHHPKSKVSKLAAKCVLSDLGLPLRPGKSICSHYSRYGICKFGPSCKKDHPVNYTCTETSAASELNQFPSVGNSMNAEEAIGVGI